MKSAKTARKRNKVSKNTGETLPVKAGDTFFVTDSAIAMFNGDWYQLVRVGSIKKAGLPVYLVQQKITEND